MRWIEYVFSCVVVLYPLRGNWVCACENETCVNALEKERKTTRREGGGDSVYGSRCLTLFVVVVVVVVVVVAVLVYVSQP